MMILPLIINWSHSNQATTIPNCTKTFFFNPTQFKRRCSSYWLEAGLYIKYKTYCLSVHCNNAAYNPVHIIWQCCVVCAFVYDTIHSRNV